MALHRDIYWVGRQWAVTGYGMQAVDPKLKGQFDIETSRLWDDDLPETLNAGGWLNADDFAKALSVARARNPQPPRDIREPPQERAPNLILDSNAGAPTPPPQEVLEPLREKAQSLTLGSNAGAPTETPTPTVPGFAMRIDQWPAKFLRPWRARIGR
jgi:hypothetical protein